MSAVVASQGYDKAGIYFSMAQKISLDCCIMDIQYKVSCGCKRFYILDKLLAT